MTGIHATRVEGGTIPLVFLHGLFGQGKNWQLIAKQLTPEATSLLVDSPNHGQSEWTEEFDFDAFADDIVARILTERGFESGFALVGHSMGGKLAMRIALRYPQLVLALVVVDIAPAKGSLGSQFPALVSAMQGLPLAEVGDRATADRLLARQIPTESTRGFLLQNLVRDASTDTGWRWRMNLDLLGRSLELVGSWPPVPGTYQGPALWLSGELSDYVRPEHEATIRELFPAAILVRVKGAGHWVHADQPETVVGAIRTFLANAIRA